ncbi:ABC transporter ATP-binding protein [Rhodoplanes sp. Z2-YC6860]|uniref:ABC transporter ATP-binding protein n=1 Tax=Rhodoplanes sp. Z2-YC6860 TaxID=674703 RepID=UPI00078C963C|nr:ABC transporter ATP-binding protein [Rhodoplanes sp. Z2-YC6860]AMN41474.1 polyamine-transporting ATPase [Rhodoplanes sp. Z2-YC6860]
MIEISNLFKSFADRGTAVPVLDNISLSIAKGTFFTLLGPSGCGKTTLLRCIAGLETPGAGEIRIDGELVFSRAAGVDIPVHRRNIGMVFQSYAIWPHMTVFDNVAFPLKAKRMDRIDARVMNALEAVELADFAQRPATRLSGGQQQRVALARAIVAEPTILLLDEPLSNLDAGLREQMRSEMRRLQRRLKLTTVLVTHDQEEALALSDRVALLRAGRIVDEGPPLTLYGEPQSVFAAEFIGNANVFEGVVESSDNDLTMIRCSFGVLWSTAATPLGPKKIIVRPEKIRIIKRATAGTDRNVFTADILDRKFLGGHFEVTLALGSGEHRLVVRSRVEDVEAGDRCTISIEPNDVRAIVSRAGT